MVSDKCLGLVKAVSQCFPKAEWQRRVFHFHRNILSKMSREKVSEVTSMLKAIHAQENREAAKEKAEKVEANLVDMRLRAAAQTFQEGSMNR